MQNFRQGDVYLLATSKPSKAKDATPKGDIILALGEVTGHAHRIASAPDRVRLWEAEGQRYVEVKKPVTLTHEEHGPITLDPGWYEARIQRVYEPGGEIRRVAD